MLQPPNIEAITFPQTSSVPTIQPLTRKEHTSIPPTNTGPPTVQALELTATRTTESPPKTAIVTGGGGCKHQPPLSGLTSQTHPYWGEYIPRSFRRPCCQTQFAIYTRRSKYIDALLLRRQGRVSEKLLGRMLVGD
jgi:hypothetical protein